MKNLQIIPDTNFRNILKKLFPKAFENGLLDINNEEIVSCEELKVIDLNIKDLTGIEWFINLVELSCGGNQLTTLPNLPKTLKGLYCYNNSLTTLPELPKTLKNLYSHSNQLTTLPELPDTLERLWCSRNKLTNLPTLPDRLKQLYSSSNSLTTLPNLPDTLEYLYCDKNQLTSLPVLPGTLEDLYCHDNNFTNNENIFIDSKGRVIVKQNDKYFFDCECNKTAIEAKKLCLEHDYNEAIEYFGL